MAANPPPSPGGPDSDLEMEIVLGRKTYCEIVLCSEEYKGHFKDLEILLSSKYGLPRRTAASIISINFVRRMKSSHFRVTKQASNLWQEYQNAVAHGDKTGILIRMAQREGSSPALIAKVILEQYLTPSQAPKSPNKCQATREESRICSPEAVDSRVSSPQKADQSTNRTRLPGEGKNAASRMIRDTTLIDDGRLASEILLCNFYDDQYGPISEMYNRAIGEEFEYLLYEKGREASLVFQSEEDLRSRGYDKTPDLKLDVPIAVGNFVVNWIESKGLFGDQAGHRTYIAEQYASYWNRFGPGLVIYWLGYEESVVDPQEKRFIVRSAFPRDITYTKPLSVAPGSVPEP